MSEKYLKVTADGDMAICVHKWQHFLEKEEFLKLYQELHAIFGKYWIACSDRLPENYSIVLCVIRLRDHPDSDYKLTRRMKFIYGNNENKNWYEVSGESNELSKMDIWEFNKRYEVTHWHPIPTL